MNLPNKLTLLRIAIVPFFVLALVNSLNSLTMQIISLILFLGANVTDILDGYIARSRNMITDFGKFVDPIADKLLVASAIICLVELGSLKAWVAILIIGRDFIISGFRLVAANKGIVIAASKLGRSKTVSQCIMICLLIFNFPSLVLINDISIIICVILTIVSLLDHMKRNISVLSDVIENK